MKINVLKLDRDGLQSLKFALMNLNLVKNVTLKMANRHRKNGNRRRFVPLFFVILVQATLLSAQDPNPKLIEMADDVAAHIAKQEWPQAEEKLLLLTRANPLRQNPWRQLGSVRYRAGKFIEAAKAFERALELKAALPHDLAYTIASCYARANEKEKAYTWLAKAFGMGYGNLDQLENDKDFESIKNEPKFQAFLGKSIGKPIQKKQSRIHDLRFLAEQVDRVLYPLNPLRNKQRFTETLKKLEKDAGILSDNQFLVGLMEAMAYLGDGHTRAFPDFRTPGAIKNLPLDFYSFQEGIFIIASKEQHKGLLGGKVISIDDTPIETIWKGLDRVAAHDNEVGKITNKQFFLQLPQVLNGLGFAKSDDRVIVKIQTENGTVVNQTVETGERPLFMEQAIEYHTLLPGQTPLYLRNSKAKYWFEHLPEKNMVYFQMNEMSNDSKESIAVFCKRLQSFIRENRVRNLVIDMRFNNGGNAFFSKPLLDLVLGLPEVNIRKQVFVIIGRRTYSAAQIAVSLLERFANVIFVGERSGSSPNFVGEDNHFALPYTRIDISLSNLFHQSGWSQDQRMWIAPEIPTEPTFDTYVKKKDSAMEEIFKVIN